MKKKKISKKKKKAEAKHQKMLKKLQANWNRFHQLQGYRRELIRSIKAGGPVPKFPEGGPELIKISFTDDAKVSDKPNVTVNGKPAFMIAKDEFISASGEKIPKGTPIFIMKKYPNGCPEPGKVNNLHGKPENNPIARLRAYNPRPNWVDEWYNLPQPIFEDETIPPTLFAGRVRNLQIRKKDFERFLNPYRVIEHCGQY